MKKIFAVAAVAAALFTGSVAPAYAAEPVSAAVPASTQSLCPGNYVHYTVASSGYNFQQATGSMSYVSGDTGVTLSISTSTSFTVSGSLTTTGSITASSVVASVQASVGVTVTQTKSGTTTNSGAWTVPSNYLKGALAIGSLKYHGTVYKYLENSACVDILQATTAYNAPQNSWHFATFKIA
jgi:hypothetical protein